MRRKSNKLYAIQVVTLSAQRDRQLSEILNSETYNDLSKQYVGSGSHGLYLSDSFSHVKMWKTHNGCKKYLENIILKNGGLFSLDYSYDTDDWARVTYEICIVNDEWNQHIDKEVEKENGRHEMVVKRLLSNKI